MSNHFATDLDYTLEHETDKLVPSSSEERSISTSCNISRVARGYRCNFCSYVSEYNHVVKRHQRSFHTREYFYCDQCPQRFADKSKLVYHQKAHRGELRCRLCHKVFLTKGGQYHHEKTCTTSQSNLI